VLKDTSQRQKPQKLALGFCIIIVVSLWTPLLWARNEPAPVVEGDGDSSSASGSSIEARVSRLERLMDNQALVDMSTRLDSLQDEIQNMEGKLEEQQHAMDELKKRQRDLYLDIDQRISKLEKAGADATQGQNQSMGAFVPAPAPAAANGTPAGGVPASTPTSTMSPATATGMPVTNSGAPQSVSAQNVDGNAELQKERTTYERAFNLLKDGRYDLAISSFKAFIQSYPKSSYADNAQYWLGEANYVQRNYKVALVEFKKVIINYPASSKRADAILKMGYTYQNLGQIDQARQSLNDVVKNFPNTTAANLAQKRLQDLKLLQ
jgi:tol-pal system protein YbgF